MSECCGILVSGACIPFDELPGGWTFEGPPPPRVMLSARCHCCFFHTVMRFSCTGQVRRSARAAASLLCNWSLQCSVVMRQCEMSVRTCVSSDSSPFEAGWGRPIDAKHETSLHSQVCCAEGCGWCCASKARRIAFLELSWGLSCSCS